MRNLKFAAVVQLTITAISAFSESSCGSVSTVFVTVPASEVTTTITIALDKAPSNTNIGSANAVDVAPSPVRVKDVLTHITTTITDYVVFTQVVNNVEASPIAAVVAPTPAKASPKPTITNQGPYYFTVHGGTTYWIGGKTPPAGKSYSTSTTIITVQPIPSSIPLSNEDSTSYSTVTLTRISLVWNEIELIKTLPKDSSVLTYPASTGISTASTTSINRLESTGWNTTSTSPKFLASDSDTTSRKPARHQLNAGNKFTTHSRNSQKLTRSGNATKSLEARQLGATVFATIEGVLVSWVNTYSGASPATPDPIVALSVVPPGGDALIPTPTRAAEVSVYPWDLQPLSSSVPAETVKAPIYPWNSQPLSKSAPVKATRVPIYLWDSIPFSSFDTVKTASAPTTIHRSLPTHTAYLSSGSSSEQGSPSSFPTKVKSTFLTLPRTGSTQIITSIISVNLVDSTSLPATLASSNRSRNSISMWPAISSSCDGKVVEEAEFTIDFDDLPRFFPSSNDTDIPPIFNPYRKLFFEDHYGYVPPPDDPFLPHSPPQLAVYKANAGQNVDGSPDAGLESVGEFGAGPRGSNSAFWVDARSVWLGCANEGPSDCIVTINGYDFIHSTRVVFQTVTLPPCPGLMNCKLTFVRFAEAFRNLSGIQILAAVDQTFTVYYMDDLKLAWSNNTCAAQLERSSVR